LGEARVAGCLVEGAGEFALEFLTETSASQADSGVRSPSSALREESLISLCFDRCINVRQLDLFSSHHGLLTVNDSVCFS
jgi:hypothetical protein